MEEETKPRIKKRGTAEDRQKPIHTVAAGAICGQHLPPQAPSGYAYYAYSLKRTYQSQTTRNQIQLDGFFCGERVRYRIGRD